LNYSRIYQEDQLLPLSGLQHIAFCERQWALIHIEQQWDENQRTAEGRVMHDKAHDPNYKSYKPGTVVVRGMRLHSLTLGIFGEADVVEFVRTEDGSGISLPGNKGLFVPRPVEYKRGKTKKGDYDRIQLCAQAICLEEMLQCCIKEADLYYGETRRRETVALDQQLRDEVRRLSEFMHRLHREGLTPKPDMKLSVCKKCSMFDICLPNMRKKTSVKSYWDQLLGELTPNENGVID
jgi:CRISPR-associated exonuclease Cas4